MSELLLESSMTETERIEHESACRQFCIDYMEAYKDHPDKDKIWSLLTSKGDEKLIYGHCPV